MQKWYSYLTLRRPPMPGGIPKDGLAAVKGFEKRSTIFDIDCWGIVVYDRPLTEKEIDDYELSPLELGFERETP